MVSDADRRGSIYDRPIIEPPDSELAAWAARLVRERCHPEVVGHSERSFQFAALSAAALRIDHDSEVLYIGTVLHDVGLGDTADEVGRFEARGANVVRTLLLDGGFDPVRANHVWDVIALHATTSLAAHKSVETRLANIGISIDIRGGGHDELPADRVRAVLDRWPRDSFPSIFETILADEVRAHPETARFCWLESVAAEYVDGYHRADFLDSLRASAGFR